MKALREYIINFGNLKVGSHEYDFDVDDKFFEAFEYSLVKSGNVKVKIVLEKQRETFFTLNFILEGHIDLECDRCLDIFPYPVESKHRILVKLDGKETESNDELIFLAPDIYEINVSSIIYEFINLSLPLRHVCESVDKDCNPVMLEKLKQWSREEETEEVKDPRWEALKNLKDEEKH